MKWRNYPFLTLIRPWLLGVMMCLSSNSFAVTEWAGVRYLPTLKSGTSSLVLNGAGISYKALTKQYTIGLYVPSASSNATELINMAGAKQLRIVMLVAMRVDDLGATLAKGIEANSSPEEFRLLIRNTIEMGQVFAKIQRINPGDTLAIDYQPERGTQFLVNDRQTGNVIAGSAFFNAILKSWIGSKPTSQALRNEILKVKETVSLDVLDK